MAKGNSCDLLYVDFLCFYVLYAIVILFYYVYCLFKLSTCVLYVVLAT